MQPIRQTALKIKVYESIVNWQSVISTEGWDTNHHIKDGKIDYDASSEIVPLTFREIDHSLYEGRFEIDRIYSASVYVTDIDTWMKYSVSFWTFSTIFEYIRKWYVTIDTQWVITMKVYLYKGYLSIYTPEQDHNLFPESISPANLVRGFIYKTTTWQEIKYYGKVRLKKKLYSRSGYEWIPRDEETEEVGYFFRLWRQHRMYPALKGFPKIGKTISEFDMVESIQEVIEHDRQKSYKGDWDIISVEFLD